VNIARRHLAGAVVLLPALLVVLPLGAASPEELFRIERSTNRNVVEYDMHVLPDGQVDGREPVRAYWRLFAEDGRKEDLTWLEKQFAYGFTVSRERGDYVLRLSALAKRPLRLRRVDGRWRAFVSVAGKASILRSVWVQVDGGLLGPSVRWVDVRGEDEHTGERRVERIENH
jgi:hypothetical protein